MSNLATILKQWRWASKLSIREAAGNIGIGASTLCRIEQGKPTDGETLRQILQWILS